MEIRKIKHKDGKTEIHFNQANGNGTEETVFKCEDKPKKGFLDALTDLKEALEGAWIYLEEAESRIEKLEEKVDELEDELSEAES